MEELCFEDANCLCKEIMVNIGKNVKRIRKEKDATQNDLAYYIGADKSTISAIECNAITNITLYTLVKICVVMNVNLVDLISE